MAPSTTLKRTSLRFEAIVAKASDLRARRFVTTRKEDVDKLQHIHYSRYVEYVEVAHQVVVGYLGWSIESLAEIGLRLAMREQGKTSFRRPLLPQQEVIANAKLEKVERLELHFTGSLWLGDSLLDPPNNYVCSTSYRMAFVDSNGEPTRRVLPAIELAEKRLGLSPYEAEAP
jgi:acyl-CoA thioesterase FadM